MIPSGEAIAKVVPAGIGGITGLFLIEYNGQPLMITIGITSVGLFFGMLAALGRPPKNNSNPARVAFFNGGALWITALWLALEVNTTAIMSVGVGIAGQAILELLEQAAISVAEWGKTKVIGFFKRVFGE